MPPPSQLRRREQIRTRRKSCRKILKRLSEELIKPIEVVGHGPEGNIGSLCHFPVGGAGYAVFGDNIKRYLDEPLAPLRVMTPRTGFPSCCMRHAKNLRQNLEPSARCEYVPEQVQTVPDGIAHSLWTPKDNPIRLGAG